MTPEREGIRTNEKVEVRIDGRQVEVRMEDMQMDGCTDKRTKQLAGSNKRLSIQLNHPPYSPLTFS